MTQESSQHHRDAFVRIFAQNDRWLYAYLMAMLGNPQDVEEVYQEVCVVLWRDYEKFDVNTDFRKWASVIAKHRVLQFRYGEKRRVGLLSEQAMELIADEAVAASETFDARRFALSGCISKLRQPDKDLIQACYSDANQSLKEVAAQLERPANTVYKAMQRIRRVLRTCIERKLAANT